MFVQCPFCQEGLGYEPDYESPDYIEADYKDADEGENTRIATQTGRFLDKYGYWHRPIQEITPELAMCQQSEFGCPNCLWSGIECENYSRFGASVTHNGQATCTSYVYAD